MPEVSILPNGGTMYMKAPAPKNPPPKRSDCKGWTRRATRGNTDFLLSVEQKHLTGHGLALSLTVRDCPETPEAWKKIRAKFLDRLRYHGMTRLHWLTEWQRRQVPHLHAAVWFDQPVDPLDVIVHWIRSAAPYRPRINAQHAAPIYGAPGWFEYLAKHAARGVAHYQRSPELIPEGWQGKTGRVWGKVGQWPTTETKTIDPPEPVWHQFRRLMIRYQIGKARRQRDPSRSRYFRRYRQKAPPETSRAQALPRLWIPEEHQWELLRSAFDSHSPKKDPEAVDNGTRKP